MRWLILLALSLLFLLWLSGPGMRWLVPQVAGYFLGKSGITAALRLEGNLLTGISISDLKLEGERELKSLTIKKITPLYHFRNLVKGQLDGLTVDTLHLDLRLGLSKEQAPPTPLDLSEITRSLRTVRARILPTALKLTGVTIYATKDEKPIFTLAPTSLSHEAGSDDFQLELGAITRASDKPWPAQNTKISWQETMLAIDKIEPLPSISIQKLNIQLPLDSPASLETELAIDSGLFTLVTTPGFSRVEVKLREGKVDLPGVLNRFGIAVPAAATLTSFSGKFSNLMPDPAAATGKMQIFLENVALQEFIIPTLKFDATLTGEQASIAVSGAEISITADAAITRVNSQFLLGETAGQFTIANLPKIVKALAAQVPAIDREAPVPDSTVAGNFNITFQNNLPLSANVETVLKPKDNAIATGINIKARWANDLPLACELALDGLKGTASYQIDQKTYKSTVEFADFKSSRISPWLAIGRIKLGGNGIIDGLWEGGGELVPATHRGELALTRGEWARPEMPLISAIGALRYEWPASVQASGFRVQMSEQVLALEAEMREQMLTLKRFSWSDGKEELLEGTANLPVPQDFSKWREMLASDTRSLDITVRSKVLSLGLLKEWLPAAEKLDPRSTGQLNFTLSGTYKEPKIDALITAKDLRSPQNPKLPPADLSVSIKGADRNLVVLATATAPDFPAAELKAVIPFRPAEWAENPALIQDEPLNLRLDLPRLDLSRFSSLVPEIEKITGSLTGNAVATGKLAKPVMKGEINLTGGSLRFKNEKFPTVEAVNGAIELQLEKAILKTLTATIAGGTLEVAGSLGIAGGKLANLDFRLRGDHLPVLRNDLLVLRSNVDLTLRGPFETAALAGTVGVVDSVFFREIELLPIGAPFNSPSAASLPKIDVAKPGASALPLPFQNWGLNVTLRTEDPILILGNLARGEITGSLRVGGSFGTPLPDGEFTIKDFRASLPFSTLTIPSGKISFSPASGLDPSLEIRGFAEPRPYRVTVYVTGKLSNPQLILTSNPPLPENEIMTLLATGTTTKGLENPQVASSRAIQLLAEELRRGRFLFGKQLRPVLGLLDRVDFSVAESDPYSDASFSTATVALTDRWFLAAGMDGEGDSRAMVIWRLSFR